MGGFSNYLVTKTGNLVRTFIQSPDFVHLVSGWSIFKDGSAEFNNIIIRGGEVIGGTTLIYNGTPAAGNLIASIAAAGGTDAYGNAYLGGGFTSYLVQAGVAFANNYTQNTIRTYSCATGQAGPYVAGLALFEVNTLEALLLAVDTTNTYQSAVIVGSGGDTSVSLQSGNDVAGLPSSTVSVSPSEIALSQLPASGSGSGVALTSSGVLLTGAVTSTSGTAAAPSTITTDTWHSLGSAGATGCTLEQARYTLTPEIETMLDIALVVGSGGSTPGTYTWGNVLPAAYQFPGSFLRIYPLTYNAAIAASSQASIIAIDGAGTANPGRVRITIPALASGVVLTGTPRIPLT